MTTAKQKQEHQKQMNIECNINAFIIYEKPQHMSTLDV